MKDEAVVEAARLLRGHLADVVSVDRIERLDREISECLGTAGAEMAEQLRTLIASDEDALQWVEDLLDDPDLLPPELQEVRSAAYGPALGAGDHIPPDRYVCPVLRDTVWYRREVGQPIPKCGTHGCVLVRVDR